MDLNLHTLGKVVMNDNGNAGMQLAHKEATTLSDLTDKLMELRKNGMNACDHCRCGSTHVLFSMAELNLAQRSAFLEGTIVLNESSMSNIE